MESNSTRVGLSLPQPTATPDGQEAKRQRLSEVSEADLNMPLRFSASKPSEFSDIPDDLEYVSGEEESEEDNQGWRTVTDHKKMRKFTNKSKVNLTARNLQKPLKKKGP